MHQRWGRIKHRINLAAVSVVVLVIGGCSAHSTFNPRSTTDTDLYTKTKYPPHSNPVLVTEEPLPAGAKYELIGQVDVGKAWYGDTKDVRKSMAHRARELGADAVIRVRTWHQASGWSWSAPHGSGQLVKILDPKSVDWSAVHGPRL